MSIDHTVPIVVDGLRIGSHQVGDGPAVVLLHGYVGDGATTWQRQLDALSDERAVLRRRARPRHRLPPDVVDQRLSQALALSSLTADEFVDTLLPTMFATVPAADDLDRFAASMRSFHPAGFRAMARASAEDLRGLLSSIDVPALLVCGDQDVRAQLPVAEHLHNAIAGSELHRPARPRPVCNLEGPDQFNARLHRHH